MAFRSVQRIHTEFLSSFFMTLDPRRKIMREVRAFSPCHITGFFQIFDQPPCILDVGSRGAGVSLSLGVMTAVKTERAQKTKMAITINGAISDSADVSAHVINTFLSKSKRSEAFRISVEHHVGMPIGAGFGTSGAAALSLALALNEALDLGLSKIEAAQVAHSADAECMTGLGTVIAETFGGMEIRVKPGAPGVGQVEQIAVPKDTKICCLSFGPLSTKRLLADPETRRRINEFGGKLVNELMEAPGLSNFLRLSRQFTEHVNLASDKVKRVFAKADDEGIMCSMPMFGESVFTIVDPERLEDVMGAYHASDTDGNIITSNVDFEGARILT